MYIPTHFMEVAPGVIEKKEKGLPVCDERADHYDIEAIRILKSDFEHYRKLREFLHSKWPDLPGFYRRAVAVGGGSPKMEFSLLASRDIVVLDGLAEDYRRHDPDFRSIFQAGERLKTEYRVTDLSQPFAVSEETLSCVTFVHFLEHCSSWENVCRWISQQSSDIVIYGPNIEAARDDNWVFFAPPDHNVFFTIAALTKVAEEQGYNVRSFAYCDDMMLWMRRPRSETQLKRETALHAADGFAEGFALLGKELELLKTASATEVTEKAGLVLQRLIPLVSSLERFQKVAVDFFGATFAREMTTFFAAINTSLAKLKGLAEKQDFAAIAQLLSTEIHATVMTSIPLWQQMQADFAVMAN